MFREDDVGKQQDQKHRKQLPRSVIGLLRRSQHDYTPMVTNASVMMCWYRSPSAVRATFRQSGDTFGLFATSFKKAIPTAPTSTIPKILPQLVFATKALLYYPEVSTKNGAECL